MASVTIERMSRVQLHVTDAVLQTAEGSTLSGPAQDALLAQACAESCDLFKDWLTSETWAQARPRNRSARIAEAVPRHQDYARFLDPMLTELLIRGGLPADDVPANAAALVTSARAAIQQMARKHPRSRQAELFREADSRLRALRGEVCALAASLTSNLDEDAHQRGKQARRRRARTALKTTLGVIPSLVLTMLSVTPAQVDASAHAWIHDASQVVSTYLIAFQAQPGVEIWPPELSGPEPGPG